jgi:hypothetical protein
MANEPGTRPISEAPAESGQPLLLFVRDGRGWITGCRGNPDFLDDNNLPVQPVAFSYLPPDPPPDWL